MISEATIKRLLALVSEAERTELLMAVNDRAKCFERRKATGTPKAKADFEQANAELQELAGRLMAVYLPDEAQTTDAPEFFRTANTARRWIEAQGIPCKRSKFYKDIEHGLLTVRKDKTVSRVAVLEYMLKLQQRAPQVNLDLIDHNQDLQRLQVKKLDLEVQKLEIATRAADREWMRTEDHWAHLAALLALCKGNLEHYARMAASEIVLEAGGDYHLAPQVADRIVETVINRSFNELAVHRIESGRFEEIEEQGESA